MILKKLALQNVRNHARTTFAFHDNIVILWGANGAGKTTILEAISMLCTTRSFVTKQDKSLLRFASDRFAIAGDFVSTAKTHHAVSCRYPGALARKEILLDHAPLEASADLIGRFPLVMLSPQHRPITTGGPAERRSFMDFVISQVYHHYLEELMEYRRIVRQRNALLSQPNTAFHHVREQVETWDAALAKSAVSVTRQRLAFIRDFEASFIRAMDAFIGGSEIPALTYRASADISFEADNAVSQFGKQLQERLAQDLRLKTTGIGPHRDDLEILLNGLDVRTQASQGQHKTLLIAMKIAELSFVSDRMDEVPILLLDDIFSELDDERLGLIMNILHSLGSQIFITTVNEALWKIFADGVHPMQVIEIVSGAIVRDSKML